MSSFLATFSTIAETASDANAAISLPVLRAVLIGTLWLIVAAIVIGPLVKFRFGDLWQRKDDQPFIDDVGGHH